MILQCQKCNLFFRSFGKMKHHKAGTLGEQCAGEEKNAVVEKPEEPVEDASTNPWNYNLIPATPVEVKQEVKSEEAKPQDGLKEGDEMNVDKTVAKDENLADDEKNHPKVETDKKYDIKIKTEPLDADSEVKIKEEPLDGDVPFIKREPYSDGIYKAAPIVLDSDSDEFEPESDESAPSDDDVETHLGLMRRNTYKVKAKKRKKTPANGTVIYIKNAAGQKVKKYSVQKESTRWVPPHPWVPYRNQVTVEQVCQFLEMVDYPIAMNEVLQKKFEDKQAFDDYAMPLFKKVNPDAHPLTLMTLMKAKWFEVMNTVNEEVEKDETKPVEEQSEDQSTEVKSEELKEEIKTIPAAQSQFATKISVKPPLQKKIRLNWTL